MAADFTTSIAVSQTPEKVFHAINNVRGWWSEEIIGSTANLHDEFDYRYKDVHRSRMKVIESKRYEKVVWLVMDNYFNFTQDEKEWTGTKIIFEITKQGAQTELRFTHSGLVPQYECFEICKEGWSNYINNSLRDLIIKGKGTPNPKEGGFNEQLAEKWNVKQ